MIRMNQRLYQAEHVFAYQSLLISFVRSRWNIYESAHRYLFINLGSIIYKFNFNLWYDSISCIYAYIMTRFLWLNWDGHVHTLSNQLIIITSSCPRNIRHMLIIQWNIEFNRISLNVSPHIESWLALKFWISIRGSILIDIQYIYIYYKAIYIYWYEYIYIYISISISISISMSISISISTSTSTFISSNNCK